MNQGLYLRALISCDSIGVNIWKRVFYFFLRLNGTAAQCAFPIDITFAGDMNGIGKRNRTSLNVLSTPFRTKPLLLFRAVKSELVSNELWRKTCERGNEDDG